MSWIVLVCYFVAVEGYPDCVVHDYISVTHFPLIASTWSVIPILGPQIAIGRFLQSNFLDQS